MERFDVVVQPRGANEQGGLCGFGDPSTRRHHFAWCDGLGHFAEGWRHLNEPVTREVVHGTHDGYSNHRCRCDACRAAETIYRRGRRLAWA